MVFSFTVGLQCEEIHSDFVHPLRSLMLCIARLAYFLHGNSVDFGKSDLQPDLTRGFAYTMYIFFTIWVTYICQLFWQNVLLTVGVEGCWIGYSVRYTIYPDYLGTRTTIVWVFVKYVSLYKIQLVNFARKSTSGNMKWLPLLFEFLSQLRVAHSGTNAFLWV